MSNYTTENLVPVLNPENGVPAIRIGNQVFVMGSGGSGGGGATDFYKCASVSSASTVTGYTVSGAGYSDCNGTYTDTKITWNNHPLYSMISASTQQTYYLFHWSSYWIIATDYENFFDPQDAFYTTQSEQPTSGWSSELISNEPAPTVTAVMGTNTWTGYKAVLSGGVYSFESTATSGLTYTTVTPQIGSVYADGALVQANLYQGMPTDGLVFYAPLSESAAAAQTGQLLTTYGTISYGNVSGIPCAIFDGSSYITFPDTDLPLLKNDCTFSVWAKRPTTGDGQFIFYYGYQPNGGEACGIADFLENGGYGIGWGFGSDAAKEFHYSNPDTWHHICFMCSDGTAYLFLNGVLQSQLSYDNGWNNVSTVKTGTASIGARIQGGSTLNYPGSIAALRIYNRALTSSEIATLYSEFTPSAS